MVDIIENWEVLASYAGDKLGFYQVIGNDEPVEIRVNVGRVGFVREFKTRADPLCNQILAFCRQNRYVLVSRSIRDEVFFSSLHQ